MSAPATGNFSLDVQSIKKLKYSAREAPQEGLQQTAKKFEALFLQKMLKQMRDAMPKSELLRSNQSEMYNSLMDRQWAQTLAERGIGLADMLTQQLQDGAAAGRTAATDNPAANARDTIGGIPRAEPQALAASAPIADARRDEAAKAKPSENTQNLPGAPLIAAGNQAKPLFAGASGAAATAERMAATGDAARALLPEHVNTFLDRMEGAAQAASRDTGIPRRLILAQAALETGWGRHEVTRADGEPSYNLFNIKATGWEGESARVDTTEFENGRARATRADFRVYDSYEQAFGDYTRLLTQSERYQSVVNAPTAEAAARELQTSGYATDPQYADKLISIMSQLPDSVPAATTATPLFAKASQGPLIGADRSG